MSGRPGHDSDTALIRGSSTSALRNFVAAIGLWCLGSLSVMLMAGCDKVAGPPGSTGNDDTTEVVRASDFRPADSCQMCHPRQFDEWSGSMHAYSLKDPTFAALRRIGQSTYLNALNQACERCHSVIGSRSGEIQWGPFDMQTLSPVTQEGVGCDLCHTITGISRLSNGGIALSPGKTKHGSLRDPQPNTAHTSTYNDLYVSSEYCGSCHDLVTDGGLGLETTFREWRQEGFHVTGKTCNECHMPAYTAAAAVGGPVRTVHDHRFVGADLALVSFPNREGQLAAVTAMLQGALTVEFDIPSTVAAGSDLPIQVRLVNDKTGHDVPSGVPFIRQMWLSVIVRDQGGTILFASGQLDANGDLMDHHSLFPERDSSLFNTQATMLRADSTETPFTWEAVSLDNHSIKSGETRRAGYVAAIPLGTAGALTVEIKLRFRSFPHYVMRGLGLASLLPIPIIDMAETTRTVDVQ